MSEGQGSIDDKTKDIESISEFDFIEELLTKPGCKKNAVETIRQLVSMYREDPNYAINYVRNNKTKDIGVSIEKNSRPIIIGFARPTYLKQAVVPEKKVFYLETIHSNITYNSK